ncbi:WD40-repeat-containing domain protein [Cokeromyces recurvatus]|uniref:WD40-repeat-containing domain protein n=1 Tax=Cokeromyces recurvatus TaxID=90255 RepID=UPI00221FBAEC|nr:WD40-repeat-containing domain protein [Cokeromyces recurvatus]KAI7904079.1 WD40-repeat-containing domain protein [Cokeromyces recurvatus]
MNHLYFSSYIGLIHCVDISKGKPIYSTAQKRLEKHNRNVFTINWFNHGRNCITTSIDKQVIKWDVQRKLCLQNLKTHAGFPYGLDSPNWNEGQLAVSMGDNSIKLWSFSSLGLVMKKKKYHDYYDSTVFWKGLQGKIEKVRWHPHKEGLLAYSNEYGHVGMIDTFNSKHIPFKSYHKSQTAPYLDWGLNMTTSLEDLDMQDTLVSCGGDGIIHIYDVDHPNIPPINFNERLQEKNPDWFISLSAVDSYRCIIKIDKNAEFIAIGHTNGLVEVYSLNSLKVIYVSNCQRQRIKSLDWNNSNKRLLLASGSTSGEIAIHDLSHIDISSLPDIPVPQTEVTALLKGHRKEILDLKWSSHTDKLLLASASEDNFAAVWDVKEQKTIALFDKHRGRVLSVYWNRLDPDVIFSSSEDRFIYEWNYMDFPCKDSIEYVKDYSMMLSLESEKAKSKVKKEQYCLVVANNLLNGKVKSVVQQLVTDSLTEEQRQDATVIRYTQFWDELENRSAYQVENSHELLYGDKNDIQHLIELEENKQIKLPDEPTYSIENNVSQGFDIKLAMNLMRCEYETMDNTKANQNTSSVLTDWIILALSPMAGKQKWIELMLQQAQKLEVSKQFHLAASCYIACSHIYEAIQLYSRHAMFREAIVLAKLRLPPKDPIVQKLFADWAKELQKSEQDTLTATW